MTSLFSASAASPDSQLYQYNIDAHRAKRLGILSGYQNNTTKCLSCIDFRVYFAILCSTCVAQLLSSHISSLMNFNAKVLLVSITSLITLLSS